MAKHIVICRCCKQKFDAQIEDKDKIWVMPSKNYYQHKNCYDDWTKKKNNVHSQADDDLWFGALWDYLSKDIKTAIALVTAGEFEKLLPLIFQLYTDVSAALKECVGQIDDPELEGIAKDLCLKTCEKAPKLLRKVCRKACDKYI